MGGGGQQQQQQQPPQQPQTNNVSSNCVQQEQGRNGSDPQQSSSQAATNNTPLQCIRQGCPNPAITNPEWEDEYCSNQCVVSHCNDVFNSWVASRQNGPLL